MKKPINHRNGSELKLRNVKRLIWPSGKRAKNILRFNKLINWLNQPRFTSQLKWSLSKSKSVSKKYFFLRRILYFCENVEWKLLNWIKMNSIKIYKCMWQTKMDFYTNFRMRAKNLMQMKEIGYGSPKLTCKILHPWFENDLRKNGTTKFHTNPWVEHIINY